MLMPINQNKTLNAEHTLYCAGTGGGKTLAVKTLGLLPPNAQCILWDPHQDYEKLYKHKVKRFGSLKAIFAAARTARKSNKPFYYALTMAETRVNFLKFCEIAWALGDGNKRLDVVCEEVPQVTETTAKEGSMYGKLLQVGRKYHIVVHSVAQRVTEIPKTVLSASPNMFIGIQHSRADARRMSEEASLNISDILGLDKLEYILKGDGIHNIQRGKLKF